MSMWAFTVNTITFGAGVADAVALTAGAYMELNGGSTTQVINLQEIEISGQAAASAPMFTVFARESTIAAGTPVLGSAFNGPLNSAVAALAAPPTAFTSATTTQPQRSSSTALSRLNLSLNLFGGITRWVAAPREEWTLIGNAVGVASSLSAFTGSAAASPAGVHITYEPM